MEWSHVTLNVINGSVELEISWRKRRVCIDNLVPVFGIEHRCVEEAFEVGDTCGVMCALGDLWKTQVYALARYINRDKEIIPAASIEIPASAELSEAMNVDEGKGDPILYPYHDKLFAMWVEKCISLEFTEKLAMEGTLCETLGVDAAYFKKHLPTTEAVLEDMRHWYRRFKGLLPGRQCKRV